MAGLFGVGGPLGPISPGLSGAVNPLAILGAGIYQNDPLGAYQTMGNLQQAGMQMQQQQFQNQMAMRRHQQQMELRRQAMEAELAEKERQRRAARLMVPALMSTMGPNVADEQIQAMQQGLEAQAEAFPQAVSAAGLEAMLPEEPGENWQTLSAKEASSLGFPESAVVQRSTTTGKLRVPGAPSTTINLGGTPAQQKIAGQLERMQSANQALSSFENQPGFDPTSFKDWAAAGMAREAGPVSSSLANLFVSPDYQQYSAGAGDWIAGLLRYESGAAVPDTEFRRYYSIYFPMPGDSKETVRFKRLRRQAAEGMMQRSAGKAASDMREEIEKFTRDLIGEQESATTKTVPTDW